MALYSNGLIPLIQVYDMQASLRFYRDLLGFQVVASSPKLGEDLCHWVRLRLGDAEFMLNTAYEFDHERPALRDPARTKAHEDTGLFIAVPDVDAAYVDLSAKRVKVRAPAIAQYGMKQMYLLDPDGYVLCFQSPV